MSKHGATWPFDPLLPMKYGRIIADPPWQFELRSEAGEEKSPQAQYSCMPLEEIKALPVSHLAGADCLLFLWCTFPMLSEGMETLKAWGFDYVTGGAWHKKTTHNKTAFGTGYVLRSASEPYLIGKVGNPTIGSKSVRNLIEAKTRGHSRKPDEQYTVMEQLRPNEFGVELFARQRHKDWDAWGNQADKFEVES